MLPGAMAAHESLELLSFRRTFTLLILLVVLPSAGLSGFGVLAIINERAAVEKRVESVWSGRLATALTLLRQDVDGLAVEATEPALRLSSHGTVITGAGFRVRGALVVCDDPRLNAAVKSVVGELAQVPARPFLFSVEQPQATLLLAAMRVEDGVVGAQLSLKAVESLVDRAALAAIPPGEQAHLGLVPIKRESAEGMVARFLSGVSEAREAALGPRELATLTLPTPLQDFRLAAFADGEDPVAQASTRNRVLYGVLLALFYTTLVVGVVFTGRTLYREARLSRLKTDFVSLVSHELRTPLTSIRMFIEMLAMGRVKEGPEMTQVLGLLSKETERLSGMIEGVLDWARLESGKKSFHPEPSRMEEIVERAVSAFRAQRLGSPLELSVSVAEGLPQVLVDREALAGALLNLLQNAWKYSPDDKRLELRVRLQDGEIVTEVEDHGVGIARREHRRIFERFYRVDSTLSRLTEGSGLGLPIALRIVQAHGGRITVDSQVGQGSTFRIHLPPHLP